MSVCVCVWVWREQKLNSIAKGHCDLSIPYHFIHQSQTLAHRYSHTKRHKQLHIWIQFYDKQKTLFPRPNRFLLIMCPFIEDCTRVCAGEIGERRSVGSWLLLLLFLLPSMLSRSELSLHIKLLNGFQNKPFLLICFFFFLFCGVLASQLACVISSFFAISNWMNTKHSNRFFFLGKKHLDFCQACIIIYSIIRMRMSYDFISRRRHRCYCRFRCHHLNMVGFLLSFHVCECLDHQMSRSIMMQSEYDTHTHADVSV